MLWKTQPDNKVKSKGHNENYSQVQFTFSCMNQTLPLILTNPLDVQWYIVSGKVFQRLVDL